MEKSELLEPIVRFLSEKEAKKGGLHIKRIVELLRDDNMFLAGMPFEDVKYMAKDLLDEHSKKGGEFDRVKNSSTKKIKPGYYRLRRVERVRRVPIPVPVDEEMEVVSEEKQKKDTNYFGKAGEYAVMSELLFMNFNANNMSVDDGIDIIASKDNNFYFIQVKTVTLKSNRTARAGIKQKNFDKFINQQIRYVIAVKCNNEMRFFTLSNEHIRLLYGWGAIHISDKTGDISIKIRYDEATGKPVFYDEKEIDATQFEGFGSIEAKPIANI